MADALDAVRAAYAAAVVAWDAVAEEAEAGGQGNDVKSH